MGVLFGIVLVFSLFIFWVGYVVATLWGWFVVPLGVVAINYWHAVGLMCVVSAFVGIKGDEDVAESESLVEGVAKACVKIVLLPAFLLCMGWLAHDQMPVAQKAWIPGPPGIPSSVMSSIADDVNNAVAVLDRGAADYVKNNVICDHGRTLVAVKSRMSGIEQTTFVLAKSIRDPGRPNDGAEEITCGPAGFELGGQKLSYYEVAAFALNSALASVAVK